jgi:hypothetical protein
MSDDNAIRRLWDTIKGWATQNASHYIYARIPDDRTDLPGSGTALKPQSSYFRLWLCQMYLTKSRNWFRDWHPAVHASVRLRFGEYNQLELSSVARPPEDALGKGVYLNYRLTELLPFNGGVVEIEAALLALQGADYLGSAIKVLQDFSGLLVAPLGQIVNVADKVSNGLRDMVGATNGQVHLGLHETLTSEGGGGANVLRPGYLAVILATPRDIDPQGLYVRGDRLFYARTPGATPTPLEGYDYMLVRIEGRTERDDWRLKNIEEPLNKAAEALLKGETESAKAYKSAALVAAYQSPDLAVADKRRVIQAIKDELSALESSALGATGNEPIDFASIMAIEAQNTSIEEAAAKGELSLEEALS